MANPASALGEAVGKSVEREVQKIIGKVASQYGLFVDTGGPRKDKRKGKKLMYVNETGNFYQLDTVVEDKNGNPLILVESKYLRYKKHNRDKASWTCVAHFRIRTTFPTVKKSIAILMGNWSTPSKELMRSFGVDILVIPFEKMVSVLDKYGIAFDWNEKDSITPRNSWHKYCSLSKSDVNRIATEILSDYKGELEKMILDAIKADPTKPKSVEAVEVLIKTTHNEFYVKRYSSIKDVIKYLINLTADLDDLKELLK